MQNLTLTAARITTLSGPQDAVDLRRVQTVNAPFQTLGGGMLQAQSEIDAIVAALGVLPGISVSYTSRRASVAAVAGTGKPTVFELAHDEAANGMVQIGEANGSVELSIPIPNLPIMGEITGYQVLLAGNGTPGAGHSAMPANPIVTALIRDGLGTGAVGIANTYESGGQTVGGYDARHIQAVAGLSHAISYEDSVYEPAHYYIGVGGEYGTNALTGIATIYSVSIFYRGTAL
jgi:hypothetical protein